MIINLACLTKTAAEMKADNYVYKNGNLKIIWEVMIGFELWLLNETTLLSFIRSRLVCCKEIITPEFYVAYILINMMCYSS